MNNAELLHLLARVERRADHLRRYAALARKSNGAAYVAPVMAHGAWLLIRTLLLLCGRQIQEQFFDWLHGTLREQHGLCDVCGSPKSTATAIACDRCLAQMEQEDRELEIEERMERDTSGSQH